MTDLAATEEEALEEALPVVKKKFNGKKLVFFVILPLLLLGSAGTGAFMLGAFDILGDGEEQDAALPPEPAGYYVKIEDLLVNLSSRGRKTAFLKIGISLELERERDEARVFAVMPRLVDYIQVYLRELRVEDLQGAEGMLRLREELLARANAATQPVAVKDVLFRELLIQQ